MSVKLKIKIISWITAGQCEQSRENMMTAFLKYKKKEQLTESKENNK